MLALSLGCQASVNADANVSGHAAADGEASAAASGSADGDLEGKGEMTRHEAASSATSATSASASSDTELAPSRVLLGARHDLKLRPGKSTASCNCLSVALGGSRSSGMLWSAAPPDIDDSNQLTIALSSEGVECQGEPKGSLGASYWGYRISGNDVIVLVEEARRGPPLTNGAVIPKPVGSGQVFVGPVSKKLPYGRPLGETKGLCKIGNPGPVRAGGFSPLELGVDAPVRPGAGGADTPTTIEFPAN